MKILRERLQPERGFFRQISRMLLAFVFLVFTVCFTLVPAHASTNNSTRDLSMTANAGLNGFYDRYGWVPVHLTLTNVQASGQAVLRLDVNDAFDASRKATASLQWGVSLQAGKTATREIAVPGWAVYQNSVIECVLGGQVVGTASLSGNELGKVAFVGVLSDRAAAAQFFTGSANGPGGLPVLPVTFSANSLPTHANLLQSLAAVVATPTELAQMDTAHQTGLVDWVKLGGLLVVTGTSPNAAAWENSLLPLIAGTSHLVQGDVFAEFAGNSSAPAKPVTVTAAGVKPAAEVWAGNAADPVIAALSVGRGMVVQTAFAPTAPALLAWPNNTSLWTQVFGRGGKPSTSALPPRLTAAPLDSMASASAVLAPLRVPSLPFWGVMFGVYVVLVGPVVFFVLRKYRTEPLAWVILPVISLVTTILMYAVGVGQRPSGLLTEGVGVFDLVGDGTAEGYGIRSFMSPSIGSVDVLSRGQMMVLPLSQRDLHTNAGTSVYHGADTVVQYPQVSRWTLHDVLSEGAAVNQGQVQLKLSSSAKQLAGTVRNDTPYQLHDVALCWNGKLIQLGDLGPGSVATLEHSTVRQDSAGNYLTTYGSYNREMTRGIGRSLSNFAGQAQLFQGLSGPDTVLLVATTTDETPGLAAVTSQIRTSSDKTLVLVREFGTVISNPGTEVSAQ